MHYVPEQKKSQLIIAFLANLGVNKQASEWAVRGNEQKDKRVAQYLRLDFWFSWTIVQGER